MRIFSNTAIALDGKIATRRFDHVRLGSNEDLRRMSLLRCEADAILVGGNSFRNWPIPLFPDPQHLAGHDLSADKVYWNVIVSRTLEFDLTPRFLNEKKIRPLFLTSRRDVPKNFPAEVHCFDKITPATIVSELESRGVKNLLIEAGGDLIFQFLTAGLLQELFVTVCPKIIGGRGAPSLADGDGFLSHDIRQLHLDSCEQVGDELYLHYDVKNHDQ